MATARQRYIAAALAILAAAALLAYLRPPSPAPMGGAAPSRILAVTWGLLSDIAYRLVGGEVEVIQLLPPGVEIHDWEPGPEAARALARAQLVVWTVEGLDDWAARLAAAAGVRSFKASEGVALAPLGRQAGDGEGAAYDVHFWLDPRNVKILAENLAGELSLIYPELSHSIRGNAAALLEELDSLHREFASSLEPFRGRLIITQRDAFRYLGEAYGLEVMPVAGPGGEEPSALHISRVASRLGEVCAVYAEDGVVAPLLERLSRDYGVRVLMLYTGEHLALEDAVSGKGYLHLMRLNLEALLEGLRCG